MSSFPIYKPACSASAHCKLDVDSGTNCGDYGQRWHFNKALGACSLFWYGGCDANANHFSTENECFETCGTSSKSLSPLLLPPLLNIMWRSSFTALCQRFSSNVMYSRLVTSPSSSPDACFFKQDKGGCENYTLKWYFDTTQSECSRFWYGGCGGNGNRFETKETCEGLCLRRNTSKTLIRVN
uniref:BPTI/Kunitz inhibitor domain-containing protein n=1 Tax=Hucho hucho TaxID=62062 RepID=A0A4W5L577_9TELE